MSGNFIKIRNAHFSDCKEIAKIHKEEFVDSFLEGIFTE